MQRTTRRRFLLLMAGAAGAGAAAWWLGDKGARASRAAPGADLDLSRLQAVKRTGLAFGTTASIKALHARPQVAHGALAAAFAALDLIEDLMSLYRPGSQLCRLNREGRVADPHPHLVTVLRQAASISARSGGAFDATVQPLWALYAAAARQGRLPDAAQIGAVRRLVDWRKIQVSDTRITLACRGAELTLNGIAQGFAADRVAAVLREHGIEHALIDTGEIGALGGGEEGGPWQVGVQHPRQADAYIAVARLRGRCLATSGDYATGFGADHRDHHVFDPATGRSPQTVASVSVAAPTATLADALSTALMVLGPQAGQALIESTPGADAMFVLKDGSMLTTAGFPRVS